MEDCSRLGKKRVMKTKYNCEVRLLNQKRNNFKLEKKKDILKITGEI